eukprot:jgi/Mesvir1/10724/Mv13801-RA.2
MHGLPAFWNASHAMGWWRGQVLGDLHISKDELTTFIEGAEQLLKYLLDKDGKPLPNAMVFQLGDLGDYHARPGSIECFETAKSFLDTFKAKGVPYQLVTGNHDLEGIEFDTDAENLEAWRKIFGQHHYWVMDLGPAVCIGLSTVRFRSAPGSCHEVYIDPDQVNWFRKTLLQYGEKPIAVFSHAPPIGSGLTALQNVHVRNRCAWLNHTSNPAQFPAIAAANPQIKLWMSGHFHLSHDYPNSVCTVGNCTYAQVNVMGKCNRDNKRQSRLIKGDSLGFRVYTVSHHEGGVLRLDYEVKYPLAVVEEDEQVKSVEVDVWGGLTPDSGRRWSSLDGGAEKAEKGGNFCLLMPTEGQWESLGPDYQWIDVGNKIAVVLYKNMLVEYDVKTRAPLGIICDSVNSRHIRVIDGHAGESLALELIAETPGKEPEVERILRGPDGSFVRTFQGNRWLMKRKEAAAAAVAAATAAAMGA